MMKLVPDISLARLKSGLFWRTFLLLGTLTTVSMITWIGMISVIQREPQAQQISAQIISVVTITHAALTHSAPELRRELLFDLVSNEGIRIFSLEEDDRIEPPPDNYLMPEIEAQVKAKLGKDTRFSARVNGVAGFWVSFKIDDDEYWLMLDRERLRGLTGFQWLGWASLVSLLSLLGAAIISSLINLPLSRLTAAARDIAKGKQPAPLPEKGPIEILEANRSFNQMVDDLKQVESDRAVILAGISHDLRTPLARLRLALELGDAGDPQRREAMVADLEELDGALEQCLAFVRDGRDEAADTIDLATLVNQLVALRREPEAWQLDGPDSLPATARPRLLRRALGNLLDNAERHGAAPFRVALGRDAHGIFVSVTDHGLGVPAELLPHLGRPFLRGDRARSTAGTGLGIGIAMRAAELHGGRLVFANVAGGGFVASLHLPGHA